MSERAPTEPTLTRIALITALVLGGLAGCEDAQRSIIGSDDWADSGPIDPGDDDDPDPSTDMGAEWGTDMAPRDDTPIPDVGAGADRGPDPDEGVDPDRGADPDSAPPAEPDFRLPDEFEEPDARVPGEGTIDDERLPEQGEIDPTALTIPRCGTFGPAEALARGPAVAMTLLHGSPGVLFDEPALAGCFPERLRGDEGERVFQEKFFDYNWQRLTGWLWRFYSLDGFGHRLTGRTVYTGDGYVSWASYACVGSVDPEVYSFLYRGAQLVELNLERPADCDEMAAGPGHSIAWRYADPEDRLPIGRSVTLPDGRLDEVALRYELGDDGRVEGIREVDSDGRLSLHRRFEYDRAGRVLAEVQSRGDAIEMQIRYVYDPEGRLIERTSSTDSLQIGYDADGGLEFVRASNRALVVDMLGFPERSTFSPVPMDIDPVPDDEGWR